MMTELPSSLGSSDEPMMMRMMEPTSFQSAAGPMNTATCNFPSSSGGSSVFSSSFCGSPSELRKRAAGMGTGTHGHAHGFPNSSSIPIGSAPGELGASPINTNLFSGFTPVFSHGTSKPGSQIHLPQRTVQHSQMVSADDPRGMLAEFFSPRMVSDNDAPPFVHRVVEVDKKSTPAPTTGITATFTRNNNHNHSVSSGSTNHLGVSADVRYSPHQQLSGSGLDRGACENDGGLTAGKSKAIPINPSLAPELADSFSSPTGQSRGFRIPTFRGGGNAAAASYLASRSRIAGSPLTGSLFPASMGSLMVGTPDENMAIDASLTAGLYGGGFSVMMKPPSFLHSNAAGERGSSGETPADMVPFPGGSVGSEWALARQMTAASGFFGESARAPLPASLFVARGMEIGGTSSDGERRSAIPVTTAHGHLHTAEYVEPSQLDESFSDLPSSPPQFPGSSFGMDDAVIGGGHVDPMSFPVASFNFNFEGHRKIQEMLEDPDAPPFLRRGVH